MPRNQTPDLRDYRRGAESMRRMIEASLNERIVNLKFANGPAADILIAWKTRMPTVAQLLASEMNASAGPAKVGAGLGDQAVPF